MAAAVESRVCGPILRYTSTKDTIWNGSILLLLKGKQEPILRLSTSSDNIQPVSLHVENDITFWRFPMAVNLQDAGLQVSYTISGGPLEADITGNFHVPGRDDSMRILFHSCNGYDITVKPGTYVGASLWNDVMSIHEQGAPFHVLIGGGDQVYSDGVRVDGPLKEWANVTDPRKRSKMPATPQLEKEIDEWYFNNYIQWFSTELIARAMAAIPSTNIYDDHDILDGFGSYPRRYQRADIFLAIGRTAWKYYTLFQHHTPPDGETNEDPSYVLGPEKGPYIQQRSRSVCSSMGPRIVYYGLDCRTDRTDHTICSQGTYDAMFQRLDKEVVKGQTEHLLLLLGVPIFYPRLVWAEKLMTSAILTTPLKKLNQKFGVMGSAFNQAEGGIELLDDLLDHWCAGTHKKERNRLVSRLQLFAREKNVRVTILSGDVHLAAVGRVFSRLNVPQNKDPKYIVNVISSAITNAPPPVPLANLLDQRNKLHHFDAYTDENLMPLFFQNPDGQNNMVNRTTMPSRNYCIITEHSGLEAGSDPKPPHDDTEEEKAPAPKSSQDTKEPSGKAETPVNAGENASQSTPRRSAERETDDTVDATTAPDLEPSTTHPDDQKAIKEAAKHSDLAGKLQTKDQKMQVEAQEAENPTEDMIPAKKQEGGFAHASAAAPFSGTKRKHALDVSIRVEINPKDPLGRTRPYGFLIPALEL